MTESLADDRFGLELKLPLSSIASASIVSRWFGKREPGTAMTKLEFFGALKVDKMTEKKEVSRVKITTEAIKESYGKISKFYATLEGIAEKGLRKKG